MKKVKVLKQIIAKGVNTRIRVFIAEDENKEKFVIVETKKLIDFKKRLITETNNAYSIETIKVLSDMLEIMFSNGEVKNKILLKELSEIAQYSATTNIEN